MRFVVAVLCVTLSVPVAAASLDGHWLRDDDVEVVAAGRTLIATDGVGAEAGKSVHCHVTRTWDESAGVLDADRFRPGSDAIVSLAARSWATEMVGGEVWTGLASCGDAWVELTIHGDEGVFQAGNATESRAWAVVRVAAPDAGRAVRTPPPGLTNPRPQTSPARAR